MNITRGKIPSAQKVVVYGAEGIGKSTFASKFPNPLFSDIEGGTKTLDVARFDRAESYEEFVEQVKYVRDNPDICGTYVIDTGDWLEKLCQRKVCKDYNKKSIEEIGYGKGYVFAKDLFVKALDNLTKIVEKNGVNVVMLCHAIMRKFEQPDEMGAYDRWELKLHKHVAPIVKEWADALLFVNYKTIVERVGDSDTFKASGGKRKMFTEHNPCWDAKNRWDLPSECEFDYEVIAKFIPGGKPTVEREVSTAEVDALVDDEPAPKPKKKKLPAKLTKLMEQDSITEEDIRMVISGKNKYPYETPVTEYSKEFIEGFVIKHWDKIVETVKNTDDLPFVD